MDKLVSTALHCADTTACLWSHLGCRSGHVHMETCQGPPSGSTMFTRTEVDPPKAVAPLPLSINPLPPLRVPPSGEARTSLSFPVACLLLRPSTPESVEERTRTLDTHGARYTERSVIIRQFIVKRHCLHLSAVESPMVQPGICSGAWTSFPKPAYLPRKICSHSEMNLLFMSLLNSTRQQFCPSPPLHPRPRRAERDPASSVSGHVFRKSMLPIFSSPPPLLSPAFLFRKRTKVV